ncbi:MAG: 50S ribosome-binding GTPase [Hyphomicrobium sp.]|jgi:bifunctional enzyme CysN/CysC|uniref:sulfate adenylyltransferase subunit 1 n=2 Tax=Hyphomicrobium TaxID=81 RepID=UPI0025BAB72F|nr:GTP-binding protein [Hyphomicrobium sp.]MBX9861711.1 50S ribosome-binding GTPase [Hyphomicrobium sp.]
MTRPNALQEKSVKKAKTPLKVVAGQEADTQPAPSDLDKIAPELSGMLRVLTCGSVDDGKSTLIGRLLWDATDLYDDQRETLKRGKTVDGGNPDFSLLMDGLVAEREQGITIDIAWRYFDTASRRIVVIDSPGHEQYTRNMASGASHADVAILLIDARHGIKKQTRRHAAILDLVGVKRVILVVNKMDLVDWSESAFRKIEADFETFSWRFGFWEATAIPTAAVSGDNVAAASTHMPWYTGPTLLQHLEQLPSRVTEPSGPFRFPVQTVLRDSRNDFRGLAGTVSGGSVRVGETVVDALSKRTAKVLRIATMDGDFDQASQGQAVAIQLDTDIDVARGAVLSKADSRPVVARVVDARMVWLSETPYDPRGSYLLRTATDLTPVSNLKIQALLDLETLESHPAEACSTNDIAIGEIALARPAAIDTFGEAPETGSFMLVDAITGASIAGGVVTAAKPEAALADENTFVLSRAMLERGLNTDLRDLPGSEAEFRRRANEVALILRSAGINVEIESAPDYSI